MKQIPTSRRPRSERRTPWRKPVCKEWTKLFNETNLVHLDESKGAKEKYNENGVGIGEVAEINGY